MEALSFFRLLLPTATTTTTITAMLNDVDEEEEDSFFELELTVPSFDRSVPTDSDTPCSKGKTYDPKRTKFLNSTPSPSKGEFFSKRKVLPIEFSDRQQSPISYLKSAPKFGASMFRKSKSVSSSKTEQMETGNRGVSSEYSFSGQSNSKRFTKDVIQKYLKLVTPLYDKVSKKQSDKLNLAEELHVSSYPARKGKPPTGPRRPLGKSKSTSSATSAFQSPARRDDSLLEQHDGIESAILHCKQSFNSCRDLSRSARAHEKLPNSSRVQTSHESMS